MLRPLTLTLLSALTVQMLPAQQPPRATVVEDDVPRAVPLPNQGRARKAAVVEDDAPAPVRPAQQSPTSATSSRPSGPDEDLFDYAMLAYSQKEYAMAATNFGQYLSTYPKGRHVPQALYRLGECYINQSNLKEAGRCYREVVNRFPRDEIAPYAALRVGVISYNEQDFKGAATYFSFAETKSSVSGLTIQAAYYRSMAHSKTGETKKQVEALKTVIASKEKNEFLQDALLSLATVYQSTGDSKSALPILQELAETAKDDAVRADAALKAAVILGEQGKQTEAVALYQLVLKNPIASAPQRGAALVGYVSTLYSKGDYDAVIDAYNRNPSVTPPADLRPRLLIHVGNAFRGKKAYERAVEMYDMVVQYHADSPASFEAEYWRIYCFYLLEKPEIISLINGFTDKYSKAHKDHEYLNTTYLLLADHYFNKQQYTEAASAFANVNFAKLPEKLRPNALYHKGWSESEAGRHNEAVASLGAFIKDNAQNPDLPKALAKRGVSAKEINDTSQALADFDRIIKDYPTSEAVELAHYLSGIIYEKKNDRESMLKSFETLLKNFPASPAAAEASFKSGVAYADQKQFQKAITLLKQSIKLDAKRYGDLAVQRVLLCYWALEDIDNLSREVDDYRNTNANAVIPPTMLGFLGLKHFDRKDFGRAARYLTWAATHETPEDTDPRIWNYLAQALLEVKSYDDALKAIDNFLDVSPESVAKAKGYETKARVLVGLGRQEDAGNTADEGLRLVKDGVVQAQLLIVQGDALFSAGDKAEKEGDIQTARTKWEAAAGKYIVPSQTIENPAVTPVALSKAIKALERVGDKTKAEQLRDQLKSKYPDFQPGE
ncbi:MAG: tetratricopeptide repeat protein [Verrucomicrobiaceae bacterium]|nr:tetratricopeptide repeat protein [Verrucomicrobiaceae bacterium]